MKKNYLMKNIAMLNGFLDILLVCIASMCGIIIYASYNLLRCSHPATLRF